MSHTPDIESCFPQSDNGRGAALPVDPYRSLRPSFGMLVGVNDFETIDAYHRGKMWLHNAWLHGGGVVWGLDVQVDLSHGEIRVLPGLAVDRAGRELHLEHDACLDVGRWYQENSQREDLHATHPNNNSDVALFDAYVAARFKSCLTRPVPALSEPCEGASAVTSYSRVFETIELLLLPQPQEAPAPDPEMYHRLRLLFGLDEPKIKDGMVDEEDKKIVNDLATIKQPRELLAAFRRLAALDATKLHPPVAGEGEEAGLFPAVDPTAVVLANLTGLRVERMGTRWKLTAGAVDTTVRPSLLPTLTIQELLCGRGLSLGGEGPAENTPSPSDVPADAGGPRVDPANVALAARVITVAFDRETAAASVKEPGLSVFSFEVNEGWRKENIQVAFDPATNVATITLMDPPRGDRLRLILRGTGESPVLGGVGQRIPFAGAVGGPPGSEHNGHDFAFMFPSG